jgi:hypothetical protein
MKRGPRKLYFICVAKTATQVLVSDEPAKNIGDAAINFEMKYGIKPQRILDGDGFGFYRAKGTTFDHRDTVSINPKNIFPSGKNFTARYELRNHIWEVIAMGVMGCQTKDGCQFKDNELCIINFVALVSGSRVKRPTFKRYELVKFSKLTQPKAI